MQMSATANIAITRSKQESFHNFSWQDCAYFVVFVCTVCFDLCKIVIKYRIHSRTLRFFCFPSIRIHGFGTKYITRRRLEPHSYNYKALEKKSIRDNLTIRVVTEGSTRVERVTRSFG